MLNSHATEDGLSVEALPGINVDDDSTSQCIVSAVHPYIDELDIMSIGFPGPWQLSAHGVSPQEKDSCSVGGSADLRQTC